MITLERIERALDLAAQHVEINPLLLPIFERMEREYKAAQDPQSSALARARQRAAAVKARSSANRRENSDKEVA